MFFEKAKKNYTVLTIGLLICAFLLVALGYAFVRNLERIYEDQASITLHAAASNVAHFYNYNLDDSLDYAHLLAKTFSLQQQNNHTSIEQELKLLKETSSRFPFMGVITPDAKAHIVAQHDNEIVLDQKTREMLLSGPKRKNIYALAYVNNRGEYYTFYTTPVRLSNNTEALLFVAKSYSSLRQTLLPPHLPGYIRYMVTDIQGQVVESTLPSIAMGENLMDVWSIAKENSPETLQNLREHISNRETIFSKIFINKDSYYISIVPTEHKEWTVIVFVTTKTVHTRLQNTMSILLAIGSAWFIFCLATLVHVLGTQRREKKATEYAANRLQWLFDQAPTGVVRFKNDPQWTVLEYGNSFLSTIGITASALRDRYHNSWAELVHPADRENVAKNLQDALDAGQEIITLEYKLKTTNPEPIWILETLRLIEDDSGSWFWSTINNISARKNKELRDQNMTVRYRYLFEASENILYEYDWDAQILRTTAQFFKKFEHPVPTGSEDFFALDLRNIHPDDMDLFQSMQAKLKAGGTSSESLLRLKDGQGRWVWCQLRQNAWTDATTDVTKAIGEIKNVDEETRCLQKLRDDVQRDAFTGLYNKTASTDLIQQSIIGNQGERGVLCIIDVDNFKAVNDTLGHAVGDIVIKNLATSLASIFRSDDIVGRMGGDEYIVYLKNMPNLGILMTKLDNVVEAFRQRLEGEGAIVNISCSIGIAFYPTNANSYEELYSRADKALYRAKKKKGIYVFYDPKIDL